MMSSTDCLDIADIDKLLSQVKDEKFLTLGIEVGSGKMGDSGGHGQKDSQKSRAEIRRARAIRNRSSARRSRLRKKAESERDKERAADVEKRNATLKVRVDELRSKMMSLQKVAKDLGICEGVEE